MARILVIEDDTIVLEIIVEILLRYGHKVLSATNGEEGITLINDAPLDLIITDINMPKLDGNAVAEYVRNSPTLKDTPILAISGTSWKIKEGLFNDYLRKPFKVEQLLRTVELLS
jgi:CheY-like chemotaxis protein